MCFYLIALELKLVEENFQLVTCRALQKEHFDENIMSFCHQEVRKIEMVS